MGGERMRPAQRSHVGGKGARKGPGFRRLGAWGAGFFAALAGWTIWGWLALGNPSVVAFGPVQPQLEALSRLRFWWSLGGVGLAVAGAWLAWAAWRIRRRAAAWRLHGADAATRHNLGGLDV